MDAKRKTFFKNLRALWRIEAEILLEAALFLAQANGEEESGSCEGTWSKDLNNMRPEVQLIGEGKKNMGRRK